MNKWLGLISRKENGDKMYSVINTKYIIDLKYSTKWQELVIHHWGKDPIHSTNTDMTIIKVPEGIYHRIIEFICNDQENYHLVDLDNDILQEQQGE